MKQVFIFLASAAMTASAMLALSSCEKQSRDESVSVVLTYTISSENGDVMNGTKGSNADVFNEFYQKILSGELVAPSYNLVFTEKTTGAVYTVTGNWSSKDMVTLRTGSYSVVGTSTAVGDNIQEKCSLIFSDNITVDTNSQTISLKANYDCSLIIFSDTSIASLSNYNGIASAPFYKFSSYLYAFIRSQLYAEGHQADAYLAGKHTNDTEFKIYTGNLKYETGKYYVYNVISTAFSLDKMEEGEAESSNDLSAFGTANCYIVPSSGEYKFKATVKGNSTESVGTPAKAEVIWETFNTATKPNVGDIVKNVKYADGYITFTATGAKGNALIAVKNANDDILWSWHIWATDYTPDTDYDVYNNHESIKVMDRNLGALSNEPGEYSLGLIYEWGRKDPFMGSSSVSTYIPWAATITFSDCKTTSSTIGTFQYAIEHPTQYIIASTQAGDWLYSSNNLAWSSLKSINDPCPKGWRVPDGGSNCIWSSLPNSVSSSYGVTWNSTYKGIMISEKYSSNSVWYPAQGYHGDSDTYYSGYWQVGSEGRYWTTTNLGNGSDYFQFGSGEINAYHTTPGIYFSRANGMPIRCCMEL